MHIHSSDVAAVEVDEIIQRIKTVAKETPNSRSSKKLRQGMANVHNEVLVKLPDKNKIMYCRLTTK